ncbi:MAG: PaaI family thioesterase [Candidatus Nanopelagicales bacterium]|nr:PaaI family thioesterase [Candidatus Nanopelagicales bacterium]
MSNDTLGTMERIGRIDHQLVIPHDALPPQRHADAPKPGEAIASHYRNCFGCGVDHPTGLHMQIEAGTEMTTHAVFEVTQHHQGAPGIAHGGILSLAFDEALGATNWLIRSPAVTAHLEVSYRLPVPVGTKVFIEATMRAVLGRKIWSTAEGRLNSPDGPLAVESGSLYMQVPQEHFDRHRGVTDMDSTLLDIAP